MNGVRMATQQIKAPELWAKAVKDKGSGDQSTHALSPDEQFKERLMMGLRLKAGIAVATLGRAFTSVEQTRLEVLRREGLLVRDDTQVQLTERGTLVQNAVLAYVLGDE
jgi:oxygen-independent coproporphyrinogen-3 oxidase